MPSCLGTNGASMNSSSDISGAEPEVWAASSSVDAIDASDLARVVDADDVDARIDTDREDTRVMSLPLAPIADDGAPRPLPRPRSLIPGDILRAIAAEEEAILSHDEEKAHAAEVIEELLLVDDAAVDVLSEKVDRETAFNVLSHSEVLRSVPHAALFELAIGAQRHHLADRAQVFAEDTSADSFFVVETGTLEAVRSSQSTGREGAVSRLAVGQPFGLFGMLSCGTRSATVRALGPSTVLEISGAKLEEVLHRSTEARSILARYFKERLLENFVGNGPLFAGLDSLGRAALISHFQDRLVPAGERNRVRHALIFRRASGPAGLSQT